MPIDVVFPDGNEKEFVEMARGLGYSKLIFAYSDFDKVWSVSTVGQKGIVVNRALFIDSSNKSGVVSRIKKANKENLLTFVKARGTVFDRFIIEKTHATGLVDVEYVHKKDHLHFRRSGLDQVLCKLAEKNGKVFLSLFSKLIESNYQALILGRIIQNIKFCKKYNVVYSLVSFSTNPLEMKGAHDIKALQLTLGMDTECYKKLTTSFRNNH